MNPDDFEKQLQQQTFRNIPDEWSRDILQAAKAAAPNRTSFLSTLNHQLITLLWPCPQAWTGLAAVWVVILVMSYTEPETENQMVQAPPPSPEFLIALREQQQLYLELTGLNIPEPIEPPKTKKPGPRSEFESNFKVV